MPAYKGTKTLGANRSAITSKRLQDRRENYDSVFDKLTRPEQFDESNNRTPAHPKFEKPRDPKSSLKKMAEKKEYPRKMPLAPVDDAASAPPKTGASRLGRPTPEPKTPKTGASPSSRPTPKTPKTPKTPPTSDELERRYDMLRRKDLNDASRVGKPTGYKKGGSIDGCALRGKTRGKVC